jgi:hypothetical protein
MAKFLRSLLLMCALAAIAAVFGAAPARASSCSSELIHDWYVDGRIDQTYQVHCYREALKEIPNDLLVYGTLRDDITRALQDATRSHGGHLRGDTLIVGAGGGGPNDGGRNNDGFITRAVRAIGPNTADSIPIPLLVLAGLAMLLLAAAGTSVLARRVQARREGGERPPNHPAA